MLWTVNCWPAATTLGIWKLTSTGYLSEMLPASASTLNTSETLALAETVRSSSNSEKLSENPSSKSVQLSLIVKAWPVLHMLWSVVLNSTFSASVTMDGAIVVAMQKHPRNAQTN